MRFVTRTLHAGGTREFETFKAALDSPDTIISWPDLSQFCCLDIDSISGVDAGSLCYMLRPSPSFSWVSRSGYGIHALYPNIDHYHADELAALAVLQIRLKFPQLQRFELLKHTFKPPGRWVELTPNLDTTDLDRWLGRGDIDPDAARVWLESRGMEIGRRYSHTQCPIDPTADAKRDPLIVYDDGIYCHVCAAKHGHGWYSFGRLSGGSKRSDFALMVRNRVHWEHAKYPMKELTGLNDRINERIYSAALVHVHGNDVREDSIFYPRRDLIRLNRWWGTELGETYNNKVEPMLAGLPCAQFKDSKGKIKINKATVARLHQTLDLTELGYPSIVPVRGLRIYGHYLQRRDNTYTMILQNELLARREYEPNRPRYVEESQREVEYAWHLLETPFPGLNRQAIELLIAARGVAEGQVGLPPFLYVSGPSGAAKTGSILVAAAILGDHNTSVVWTNNVERTRMAILVGKERGSYVTFNEIIKQAKKAGVQFQSAMDDILNLTPDSVSHKLYVGPVPLGTLPVTIWTDTDVPIEIRDSVQLARRLVHLHMPRVLEWQKSIYESGLQQIERLRVTSIDYADACNHILSDIIDRFFQSPNDLTTIARQLGFCTLAEETREVNTDTLLEFFKAVCAAPALDGADAKRWRGPEWKLINLNNVDSGLGLLWDTLRDSDNPKMSRRCSEADWSKIIQVDTPIEFEIMTHGNRLAVRFVNRVNGEVRFNGGITCTTH